MKTIKPFFFASALVIAAGCMTNPPPAHYSDVPVYTNPNPDYSRVTVAPYTPSPTVDIKGAPAAALLTDADRELVTSVRNQFDRYGDLSAIAPNIQVAAVNGTVTLTGSVPSERDRQMVEAMVRNTPGVVSLHNQIHVSDLSAGTSTQADRALETRVREELRRQPAAAVLADNVHVDARNGAVTLTGSIPSSEDRLMIENVVRSIPGVASVVDQLQTPMQPTGRSDAGRVYPSGDAFNLHVEGLSDTDRALAQNVLNGLKTDTFFTPPLPVVDINIADGKVTLQGAVQNESQRQSITSSVRRVAGSGNVVDLLQVQPVR